MLYYYRKSTKQFVYNPLNWSQEKNNIYTYLDHKIFIQNPEMLKFIDSILYFIDLNPPLFLQFIDELNAFYKNIWFLNKAINSNEPVITINEFTTIVEYNWKTLLELYSNFFMTIPQTLVPAYEAQFIVLKTILREQMNAVYDKVNHFNFDNKCLQRYYTNDLENAQFKQDKVKNYELRQF